MRLLAALFACCASDAEPSEIHNFIISKQPMLLDYIEHLIAAFGEDPLLIFIPFVRTIHIVAYGTFRCKTQRLSAPSWLDAE